MRIRSFDSIILGMEMFQKPNPKYIDLTAKYDNNNLPINKRGRPQKNGTASLVVRNVLFT
ncbi:hypothetical protein COA08_22630 [Bacillus cereus]|uniref:Uncharacterized protein n=1 Tax=Bacillus cereus TaxID=1396 RepID=A0A2C0EKA1_BACCE|nr:hypothetical protein CON06_05960 [Bacillus cereus]PFA02492.1 hypothetical protein CN382_30160 [Bacillus cereus]PFM31339.1 hypothetical protein COJ43_28540 [Bacillus cereus]PGL54751.1 hypothetical protein CN927_30340 [Bacillus cereus]PGQ06486.1 hypothetical protein COA08_22630 [Bacillus cereus]